MMNIRRKYTLFLTNNQVNLTLFRMNNQANLTLHFFGRIIKQTLHFFGRMQQKQSPTPAPPNSKGSDMQCIYIVAEVSGLRSNQRPLP